MTTRWWLALLACSVGSALAAQTPVDFLTDVLPTLEKRCFSCHGPAQEDARGRVRTARAGLRLDGRSWIERGGESGLALVSGKPDESLLYTLTTLPKDDPDAMPAQGERLTEKETGALRDWIATGAPFGAWVGVPGPEAERPSASGEESARTLLLRTLAEGLAPPPAAAVERAARPGVVIQPVTSGSPLLRVEVVSRDGAIGDDWVKSIAPLAANIAELGLGRTAVGDISLATIARMSRLIRLDLHGTQVGDRGLVVLSALKHLRYLNLYGTGVTDRGLAALEGLKKLEAVYLWQSKVTEPGVARLRAALPACKVHDRRELPAPEAPAAAERPVRRRKN